MSWPARARCSSSSPQLRRAAPTLKFTVTKDGRKSSNSVTVEVKDCSYTVNMHATDVFSGDGVVIWTAGDLQTQIKGEGGEMQGTGNFTFVSGFVGPPCSISYTEFSNATTITGNVDDNGQLTLGFQYEPGTINSSVSCPDGGGSYSQAVDLTNTGIASLTLPASGGGRSIQFQYAGSDMPPGTMTIFAQPDSEEAGG